MKIQFISFINSPHANPANHNAVKPNNPNRSPDADITAAAANTIAVPMSRWRQEVENEFMDISKDLFDEVNYIRTTKDAVLPNTYRDTLRVAKYNRQIAWIDFLSQALFNELDSILTVLDQQNNKTDIMYVVALPEFFWRDINDHHSSDKSSHNYGMPFYNEALYHLTDDTNPQNAFAALTKKYKNLIIFAGTIWWKFVEPTDSPLETRYCNTLLTFHSGRFAHSWNKQFASTCDGATLVKEDGTEISYALRPTAIHRHKSANGTAYVKVTEGALPLVSFMGFNFGIDICIDLDLPKHDLIKPPLSQYILEGCGRPMPEIHMLIAGGKSIKKFKHLTYAQKFLFRCDILPDAEGDFADIVTATGAPRVIASASVPNSPRCFYVFAAVDAG